MVDATYGSPENKRNYKQDEVVKDLFDSVQGALARGSVVINGYRGRLQYAVGLLAELKRPFLLSESVARTIDVYARYSGVSIVNAYRINSARGREILKGKENFVAFVEPRDRISALLNEGATRILLSAFMVPKENPVLVHSNGLIRIALTDHADFSETVELIKAIAPQRVIADGTRGGNADALATFVRNELKLSATSDATPVGLAWGA